MAQRDQLDSYLENPNVQRYLNAIALAEGTAKPNVDPYRVGFGGSQIDDLSDHPRVRKSFKQTDGKQNVTTAAGKYQFIAPTWDGLAKRYGLTDFSPRNQDRAAVALMMEKGVIDDIAKGNYERPTKELGQVWASLPSSEYAQPKRSANFFEKALNTAVPSAVAAEPDIDALTAEWKAQKAAKAQPTPTAEPDIDALTAEWKAQKAATAAPSPTKEKSFSEKVIDTALLPVSGGINGARGLLRGARDLIDGPALWAAKGADWVADKAGYDLGAAQDVSDKNKAAEEQYQKDTEGSVAAGAGRVAANVGTSLIPFLGQAGKAGQAASLLQKARTLAPTTTRIGTNAAVGAATGALDTRTLDEDAGTNALLGGILGPVAGEALTRAAAPFGKAVKDATEAIQERAADFGYKPTTRDVIKATPEAWIANRVNNMAAATAVVGNQKQHRNLEKAVGKKINQPIGVEGTTVQRELYENLPNPYTKYNESIAETKIPLDEGAAAQMVKEAEEILKNSVDPSEIKQARDVLNNVTARSRAIQPEPEIPLAVLQKNADEANAAARAAQHNLELAKGSGMDEFRLNQAVEDYKRALATAEQHNASVRAFAEPVDAQPVAPPTAETRSTAEAALPPKGADILAQIRARPRELNPTINQTTGVEPMLPKATAQAVPPTPVVPEQIAPTPSALPKATGNSLDAIKARAQAEAKDPAAQAAIEAEIAARSAAIQKGLATRAANKAAPFSIPTDGRAPAEIQNLVESAIGTGRRNEFDTAGLNKLIADKQIELDNLIKSRTATPEMLAAKEAELSAAQQFAAAAQNEVVNFKMPPKQPPVHSVRDIEDTAASVAEKADKMPALGKRALGKSLDFLNRALDTSLTPQQLALRETARDTAKRQAFAQKLAKNTDPLTTNRLYAATNDPNTPADLRRMGEFVRDTNGLNPEAQIDRSRIGTMFDMARTAALLTPYGWGANVANLGLVSPSMTNMLTGNTALQNQLGDPRIQATVAALAARAANENQR